MRARMLAVALAFTAAAGACGSGTDGYETAPKKAAAGAAVSASSYAPAADATVAVDVTPAPAD